MSDHQHRSWFDPRGYHAGKPLKYPSGWLVAQIYFPTNVSLLDDQDKKTLDALFSAYSIGLLASRPVVFRYFGNADYRASERYNHRLGKARAQAVKQYLDQRFSTFSSYLSVAKSRGERFATHSRDVDVLASDRRVDVFAPFAIKTTIRVPPIYITVPYTGPLSTKFKFRTFAGGGAGIPPISSQGFSIEVMNVRTKKKATYTYTGAGVGYSFQINRPTGWEEKEVKDINGNPVWLDVEDFEGSGKVASGGLLYMKSIYYFDGPKSRGRAKDTVYVDFSGWDIAGGVSIDVKGHWHKR